MVTLSGGYAERMQFRYSQFLPVVEPKVSRAIVSKQDSLNKQSLVSLLHGLSRAGGESWTSFDIDMQTALMTAIVRISSEPQGQINHSSSKLAGNVLYALGLVRRTARADRTDYGVAGLPCNQSCWQREHGAILGE